MNDTKQTIKQETNEATPVARTGFLRTHRGRWGSLALLAGMVFMLHGVVFSTLDEVAPIGGNLSTTTEITLVIEPVTIPMQIMADAR